MITALSPVRFGLMLASQSSEQVPDPIKFFDIPKPLERQLQELAGIHGRRQVLAERGYFTNRTRDAKFAGSCG